MRKLYGALTIAAGLLLAPTFVQAVPIKWTLSGVTFNDSGTASGSFVYDADTSTYSQVQLTTTTGSVGAAASFGSSCSDSSICDLTNSPITGSFFTAPPIGDLTGNNLFFLAFKGPLTNSGGSINIAPGFGGTLVCSDVRCSAGGSSKRDLSGGSVVGALLHPPAATASPTSVDFGSVQSGQNSAPSIVTLENTGGSPLTLSAAPTTNGDFVIEGTTCSVGLVLAPTENCQVTLKMAPTSVATLTGELSFAHDATPSSTTVALRGVGTAVAELPTTPTTPTAPTAVPSLSTIALAMLSVMLAALGYRSSRRKL